MTSKRVPSLVTVAGVLLLVATFATASARAVAPSVTHVSSCTPGSERSPVSVLIADQLIPEGTPGAVIMGRHLAKRYSSPCVEVGALHSFGALKGLVAIGVTYPGQQLVRADFARIQTTTYRVDHVTDGDTVVLVNGQRVRLVQIDTPEVFFGTECYGRQASATAKRLLPEGARVRLLTEPATDRVDDFGRLLRYVIRVKDGVNINLALVAVGAAAPYFYDGRRGIYASRLEILAKSAKRKDLGLWGACPRTLYDPYRGIETRR